MAVNPAYTEITGYSEAEMIGQNPRLLQSGRHDRAFYQALWASLRKTGHWQGELWNRRKNGELYPQWVTLSTVRDHRGELHPLCRRLHPDISQIKHAEARLEHLAHYDPLTELLNRLLAQLRLAHAPWSKRSAATARSGCCLSIWTSLRPSTIASVTWLEISCCGPLPSG